MSWQNLVMRKSSVPQEQTSVQHLDSNGKASCILDSQLAIIIIISVIYPGQYLQIITNASVAKQMPETKNFNQTEWS